MGKHIISTVILPGSAGGGGSVGTITSTNSSGKNQTSGSGGVISTVVKAS